MENSNKFFHNLFGKEKKQDAAGFFKKGDIIAQRFEIHGTLGTGGFGIVYLAYSHETGEVLALKTFRDEFLSDTAAREEFKREALKWVNLDEHPFVLAARFVIEYSGRLFVTMDHIAPDPQGRVSLQDHLRHSRGNFNQDRALELALQFSYGMEHANAHGIKCHRDIKPANILITPDGILKIADFGLAAAVTVSSRKINKSIVSGDEEGFGFSIVRTERGNICGTPGYISPEVYRGEGADVRSDIYSFGLVLWQMACGSPLPPFQSACRDDIDKNLKEVYELKMMGRVPEVDSPLWPVIKRSLAAEPSRRYGSFTELREELEKIYHSRTGKVLKIPETDANTQVFWNNKGASFYTLGRHDEAIFCLDKALEIDQKDAHAWNNKGVALSTLGRNDEAMFCHDKALEIDPRNAGAWNNKGGALGALGRYDDKIVCCDKALEIDPKFAAAWYNKGSALRILGRHGESIVCHDKALEIDPRNARVWNDKGSALRKLGRLDEAMFCHDKALEIDPKDAYAWTSKGNTLGALGRYDDKIVCCDKALEIDPKFAAAWYNKGNVLLELGRLRDAAGSYRRFIELASPQDAEQIEYARERLREITKASTNRND